MKTKLKNVELKTYQKFLLFCFVGGIATFLDLLSFNFAFKLTSLFIVSRVIGIAFSMVWNFSANRAMTFQATEGKKSKQLIKYLIVYSIAMGSNVFVGWCMYGILGPGQIQANIAAVFGMAVSIPTAFIGSLLWAFKTEKIKTNKNVGKI